LIELIRFREVWRGNASNALSDELKAMRSGPLIGQALHFRDKGNVNCSITFGIDAASSSDVQTHKRSKVGIYEILDDLPNYINPETQPNEARSTYRRLLDGRDRKES
jgi:hypothetical protein